MSLHQNRRRRTNTRAKILQTGSNPSKMHAGPKTPNPLVNEPKSTGETLTDRSAGAVAIRPGMVFARVQRRRNVYRGSVAAAAVTRWQRGADGCSRGNPERSKSSAPRLPTSTTRYSAPSVGPQIHQKFNREFTIAIKNRTANSHGTPVESS